MYTVAGVTFRLGTRFWWTAALIVAVVIIVVVLTQRTGGPATRPPGSEAVPTATRLRSADMTGRVTGTAPSSPNPVRRIVTGHDASTRGVITQDGPPPRVMQIGGPGGPTFYEV